MGANTKIEWAHHTANTWWGCTKVSEGCAHCYAESWSKRMGEKVWGPNSSRRMMKGIWHQVHKWALAAASAGERRRVFWGSMMDVCEDRPDLIEPRKRFCELVEELEDLDFLILTKRPENYLRLMPWGTGQWPRNAWAGCSAENQARHDERAPHLLQVDSAIRWFSAEPLLGPVDMVRSLWTHSKDPSPFVHGRAVDWVIVGGESGAGARPCDIDWIRNIVGQCRDADVKCFVKQLGANPSASLREGGIDEGDDDNIDRLELEDPKGGDPSEWPKGLHVRETPEVTA